MSAPFNREEWLNKAIELMRPEFKAVGLNIPTKLYVSIGPTQFRSSPKSRGTIGITWHNASAKKDIYHVFISPSLTDTVEVLSTLRHELVHCCMKPEDGHKKPFADAARKVGLLPPWTSTPPSAELVDRFNDCYLPKLGKWMQPDFDNTKNKQPGSRLLRAECPECGYVIRVTKKWADLGLPWCGLCDTVRLELDKV